MTKHEKYRENYEKWIKKNRIKIGDKLRVVKSFPTNCDGNVHIAWNKWMSHTIDKIGTVYAIADDRINLHFSDNSWTYPYYVLRKALSRKCFKDQQ